MTFQKAMICIAALALLAFVCHAATDANSDDNGATAHGISGDASGDETASRSDFDGDGTVGLSDFLIFTGAFGSRQGDERYEARFDLDEDGAIGIGDFLIFAENFGKDVPSDDRSAVLVALYNATDGPNWRFKTNWLSDKPLREWYGVDTDANGRVTQLRLYAIARSSGDTVGIGSSGIHVGNGLSGEIPVELGRLSNLTGLALDNNRLTGTIPPELGQLTNLTGLTLSNNRLTGTIPSELGNLSKLVELWLGYNQLAGTIPPELGSLTKLTDLDLAYNKGLSGPLPGEFTALPLERFGLVGTQVCVYRAVELVKWLNGIETLSAYTHCRDPQWDALASLYNSTDGPNWTNKTNWLRSAAPGEWYGVTTDNSGRVTGLDLEDNNLSGTLSSALGGLANLKRLDLSSNAALSGPLPHALTRLSLDALGLDGTQVCVPPQSDFQTWLWASPPACPRRVGRR